MMKNNRFLKPAVIGLVTLLHAGVIALSWNGFKPPEPVEADAMAFVDLGSVEGDDKPLGDGAPAPMEQPDPPKPQPPAEPPKPEPKVEPKPKVVEKPKVAAVVRNDKPADFKQPEKVVEPPKREIKPEPIKQPEKPVVKPQPEKAVEPPKPSVAPSANPSSSSSNSSAMANKDAANRAPDGTGGGGSSVNSKVPQNGAGDKNGDGHGKKGEGAKPSNNSGNSGMVADGGYISLPNPPYPRAAAENGDTGVVKLSVVVNAAGKVMEVKVTKSSGSAALDNAGKRAAQSASYRPKKVDGEFVSTRFNTQFTFELI